MVKKQGLFGRVWDRLRDQQKMGIVILLVMNILMLMFGLVPQAGPVILGFIYAVELLTFIVVGFTLIFTEGEW